MLFPLGHGFPDVAGRSIETFMRVRVRNRNGSGAAAAVVLSTLGCAPHVLATQPTRVVATAGIGNAAAPGVAGGSFSVLGAPQLDNAGGLLVTCRFGGPGIAYAGNDLGLFHFDRFGIGRLLARTGVSGVPGAADVDVPGATFSATFFPRLRDDGGIAAVCFLAGSGIDGTNSTGYWTGSQEGVGLTVRSGSSMVPGVPGAQFNGFITGFPCVLSESGMAFGAQMAVGLGGVTIADYQGIWGPRIGLSGSLDLIARPGIIGGTGLFGAPPTTPTLLAPAYSTLNSRTLVLTANGRLAFGAILAPGIGVDASNDTVIVERGANGVIGYVAREGDAVPGMPGVAFKSLDVSAFVQSGGISINSAGDVAFCEIDGADVPTTGVSRLWRRRANGQLDLLASRSTAIGAGAPVGIAGTFGVLEAPAISSAGTVVFAGTVNTAAGTQVSGLWICEPGTSTPRLILRSDMADTGRSPPGLPGALFSTELPPRGTYRINARGQIIFRWKLQEGPGGITTANNDGLWAYDPALWLIGVARSGDVVQLGAGVSAPIRSIGDFLGPSGDDDGRIRDLNDLGEAAYTVQFSDIAGAMLVSQLPGVGACCVGGTCVVVANAQCIGPYTRFAGLGTTCAGSAACCAADFDQSGTINTVDIFAYFEAWFAGNLAADIDGSGLSTTDIFRFIETWFEGC